jgi:molybdopterin biosynthesis enzyme MoaB
MKEVHVFTRDRKLCDLTDEIYEWLQHAGWEEEAYAICMDDAPEEIKKAMLEAGYKEDQIAIVLVH